MNKTHLHSSLAATFLAWGALVAAVPHTATAQGVATAAVGSEAVESDLAAANRAIANPLTNNVLFIVESDTFRLRGDITDDDKYGNVTIIEPLIPFDIGDTGWTYIMRPIIPLGFSVDVPKVDGTGLSFDSASGIGDIALLNLFTPGMNDKGF